MSLTDDCVKGTIRAVDVMPLLLQACPSFLSRWQVIEEENRDDRNGGGRLHYVDAGDVARHLIEISGQNRHDLIQPVFDLIERMHLEGTEYVRELAAIGYLEDIENFAGHAGMDPTEFEQYLGLESHRWWRGLEAFWSGQHPTVDPIDL